MGDRNSEVRLYYCQSSGIYDRQHQDLHSLHQNEIISVSVQYTVMLHA